MKIALITSEDSALHFFKRLEELLRKNVAGVEVKVMRVADALDIPKAVQEHAKYDFVLVCYYFFKETYKVRIVAEKLVELETSVGVNMLKVIKQTDTEEDDDIDELSNEEKKEAKEVFNKIMQVLFGKPMEKTTDEKEFSTAFPRGL